MTLDELVLLGPAVVFCGCLACGRSPLTHLPSDAGGRGSPDAQTTADGGVSDAGVPSPIADAGRLGADRPAPNCQMNEMRSLPFEALPLEAVASLQRSAEGFWIFGNGKKQVQDRAFFGELRADGFVTHLTLPSGTSATGHTSGADGRHWLVGTATGQLSRDATTLASSAIRTGFLVELDLQTKAVEAGPIPGEPDACVADPSGGVVLAGTGLFDGREGPSTMLWARYDADHNGDWFKGLASTGTFNRSDLLTLGRDRNLVSCGMLHDDILLAKLSVAGEFLWHHEFGSLSMSSDRCYGMALDAHDNVWMSGFFRDRIDLGGGALPDQGDFTPLLSKFTPDGIHLLSFSLPRKLTDLGVDGADHLWAIATPCTTSCSSPDAVERYDQQGNLECRFPMEILQGTSPLALVPDDTGAWVVFIRNPPDPQTTIAHLRLAP